MPSLSEYALFLGGMPLPWDYRFCRKEGFTRLHVERIEVPAHTELLDITFKLPDYARHVRTLAAYAALGTAQPSMVGVGLLSLEVDKRVLVSGVVPYGGPVPALHTGGPANAWWELEAPICHPLISGLFRQYSTTALPYYLYLVFDTWDIETRPETTFEAFIQTQIQ